MKMHTRSGRLLVLGSLQLVAMTIAAAAAVAVAYERPDPVYGAYHCTRYAPSVVVRDQTDDPDCLGVGGMAAYYPYTTPSYGWRDSNDIFLSGYSQWWEIYLFDINGNVHRYTAGQGTGTSTFGWWGAQTKALCSTSPQNAIGRCYVNWHD